MVDEGTHGLEPATGLALDDIERALAAVRGRRASAQIEAARVRELMALLDEEERLLTRLIAIHRGEFESESRAERRALSTVAEEPRATGEISHPVVDEVLAYLTMESRAVHISEIMKMLRERQIRIPGSGTEANVISYLRRDSRIDRPSRGMYALTAWEIEKEEPTLVARRQKRRRTVTRVSRDDAKRGE